MNEKDRRKHAGREFLSAINEAVKGELARQGFTESRAGTYLRSIGERLDVIWIQKHSTDETCCVNLGIHYSFIWKIGSTDLPTDGKIDQPECELKIRLTGDPESNDQWWPLNQGGVNAITTLLKNRVLDLFTKYDLEGEIAKLSVDDFIGGVPPILKPMTKVRAVLLLARIHDYLGNQGQAIELAQFGLKVAGMAVGPKKAFKEILKNAGRIGLT
ncbi:MAG: DUF4304 domain-containing protein [Verrucomicrobiota bacterium]